MYSSSAYLVDQKSIVLLVDTELNTTYRWSPVFSKKLIINKGVDNVLSFQFLNQEQKPVDISLFSFTLRLISNDGENLLLAKQMENINSRLGTCRAIITAAESVAIPAQPASWSIERASNSIIKSVRITDRGRGYTSAPTVSVYGTGTGANLSATITGAVDQCVVLDAGVGYTHTPNITFAGGGGFSALGLAQITYGVESVEITNVGDGYDPDDANTAVTFSPGLGANAALQAANTANATITFAGNSIVEINIVDAGIYDAPPTVTFDPGAANINTTATAVAYLAGRLTGITVANAGRGYTGAPAITVTGGGAVSQAQATCNLTNRLDVITIRNGGQNYVVPPIIELTGGGNANLISQGTAVATVGGDALYLAGYVDDAATARGSVDIVDSVFPRFTASEDITIPVTNTGNTAAIDGVNRPVAWTSIIQSNGSPQSTFQVDFRNYSGVVQLQGSWEPTNNENDGQPVYWYQIGNVQYYDNKYGKEYFNAEGYHPYVRIRFALPPVPINVAYYANVAANIYGNSVTQVLYRD